MSTSRQPVTMTLKSLLTAAALAAAVISGQALVDTALTGTTISVAGCPLDTHWSEEQQACGLDTHW